jgi:uncharacterized protein
MPSGWRRERLRLADRPGRGAGMRGRVTFGDGFGPADGLVAPAAAYEGNSILRGGREPKVEEPEARRPMDELLLE